VRENGAPTVAVVDFGMGNLFSVQQACEHAGLTVATTRSPSDVIEADATILPGVGAFENAMENLRDLGMVTALQQVASSSKPLVGICLGMQLLMTESEEFGRHKGLNIIPGTALWLDPRAESGRRLKVPHVSWNRLHRVQRGAENPWNGTLLDGLRDGVFLYFVHSLYVRPSASDVVLATTTYGVNEFCSALQHRNVFGCQCHPERSGPDGLRVYANLATRLRAAGRSNNNKDPHHVQSR
jgi:glutamine amidotransferase